MIEPLICENERHAGSETATHILIVCSWKCAQMAAEQCGLAAADEGPDWL